MRRAGWMPLLAAAALLGGGCGSPSSGAPPAPEVGDASGVDMCTVLTEAELRGLGVDLSSRKQVDKLGLVGCQWVGEPITLRLERNEDAVAEYIERRESPAFKSFRENVVNGRDAVQFSVIKSGDDCVQLMDGGSVSLAVGVALVFGVEPTEVDPCVEALRIAEMIEPRLPKAGS